MVDGGAAMMLTVVPHPGPPPPPPPHKGEGSPPSMRLASSRPPLHHDTPGPVDARLEARGDECRRLIRGDERGACKACARLHPFAPVERHVDIVTGAAVMERAAAVCGVRACFIVRREPLAATGLLRHPPR